MAGRVEMPYDLGALADTTPPATSSADPGERTSGLRLLDLPQLVLERILKYLIPTTNVLIETTLRKLRRHGATSPPPMSLMLVGNHALHALAEKVWLDTQAVHIYLACWTILPEGLLIQATRMRHVALTLDIRSGTSARLAGRTESRLRASMFCATLRMLVAFLDNLHTLSIKCFVGKHASRDVASIIMEPLRELHVRASVWIGCDLNREECNRGAIITPALPSVKFVRELTATIAGLRASRADQARTNRVRRTGQLVSIRCKEVKTKSFRAVLKEVKMGNVIPNSVHRIMFAHQDTGRLPPMELIDLGEDVI